MSRALIVVDHVIAVCGGCKKERRFYPDKPLEGAAALMEWAFANITACPCGAPKYDLKAHIANPKESL
jgi:hypothetical protein